MVTENQVYYAYRAAKGKPFRMPKNWDDFFEKLEPNKKDALQTITSFFNTKWRNIDIKQYFSCGYELFPNMSYYKFFDQRIISLYITKDKIKKRECELDKRSIIESAKFIKKQMKELEISTLKQYCRKRDDAALLILDCYLQGKIDNIFLFYCIYSKYILLEDHDKIKISYILENVIYLKGKILSILDFLQKVEENINE